LDKADRPPHLHALLARVKCTRARAREPIEIRVEKRIRLSRMHRAAFRADNAIESAIYGSPPLDRAPTGPARGCAGSSFRISHFRIGVRVKVGESAMSLADSYPFSRAATATIIIIIERGIVGDTGGESRRRRRWTVQRWLFAKPRASGGVSAAG